MRIYTSSLMILCSIYLCFPLSVYSKDVYRATVLEGPNWTQLNNRLSYSVYGLCSSSNAGDAVWFCGENNLLMKYEDSNWYDYSGGHYGTCTDPLYDVAVNIDNPDNVIALGYDMIAITYDCGDNWKWLSCFGATGLSIYYDSIENCFIYCKDNCQIAYGGTTPPFGIWLLLDYTDFIPRGIAAVIDLDYYCTNAVAVCEHGHIYYAQDYTNGFAQFTEASVSPTTYDSFNAVAFEYTGNIGVAVGDYGQIYYSTNYGRSWNYADNVFYNLNDVSIQAGTAYAVGDNGKIYWAYTSDICNWYADVSNTDKNLYALSDQLDYSLLAAGEKYVYFSFFEHDNIVDSRESKYPENDSDLRITTNCNTSTVQLRYVPRESSNIYIALYDISGRILHESNYTAELGTEFNIDLEDILSGYEQTPTGLYTCFLREGDKCSTGSFVISR